MSQSGGSDDPNKPRRPSISDALKKGIEEKASGGKLKRTTTGESEGNKSRSASFGVKSEAMIKLQQRREQVANKSDESDVEGWSSDDEPKAKAAVTPKRTPSPKVERVPSPVQRPVSPKVERVPSPVQRPASPKVERVPSPVQRPASPKVERVPSPTVESTQRERAKSVFSNITGGAAPLKQTAQQQQQQKASSPKAATSGATVSFGVGKAQIEAERNKLLGTLASAAQQAGYNSHGAAQVAYMAQLIQTLVKHDANDDQMKQVIINALEGVLRDPNASSTSFRNLVQNRFHATTGENVRDFINTVADEVVSKAKHNDDLGKLDDVGARVLQRKGFGI